MLVHIITKENRCAYKGYLKEMFEMRRRVFIERLGWEALSAPDGQEKDFVDDLDDVEYILTIDDFGRLVGSGRFSPTTAPHLLNGPLKHFAERDYGPGPLCWEFTRYIPTEDNDGEQKLQGRAYILTAMVEWAIRRGVNRVLGISPIETLGFTGRMGWRNGLLGMPIEYQPGQSAVAMHFDLDQAAWASTRRFWDIQGPVSYESRSSSQPWTALRAAELDDLIHAGEEPFSPEIQRCLDLELKRNDGEQDDGDIEILRSKAS